MNIDRFIYHFNLVSTKTVNSIEEFCKAVNDGGNLLINYQDCTSFYDFVNTFNESYQAYKPSLEILKTILKKFSAETRFGYCRQYENGALFIAFEAINPLPNIFDEDWAAIYISENNQDYQVIATNNLPYGNKKRKSLLVDSIPAEDIQELTGIFSNHHLFLEAYTDLKDKFLFGNGTTVIFTKVEGEAFNKLDTFTLNLGNLYFNSEDYVEIKFQLGETLKILYDESRVKLDNTEITDQNQKVKLINEMLNRIYLSNSLLPLMYNQKEEPKQLRKKEQ